MSARRPIVLQKSPAGKIFFTDGTAEVANIFLPKDTNTAQHHSHGETEAPPSDAEVKPDFETGAGTAENPGPETGARTDNLGEQPALKGAEAGKYSDVSLPLYLSQTISIRKYKW